MKAAPYSLVRLAPWPLAALALAVAAGCGDGLPKTHPAKGRVVYKDNRQPVKGGIVEFVSVSDPTVRAVGDPIGEDGTFTLVLFKDGKEKGGAAEGEYQVFVELRAAEGEAGGGRIAAGTCTIKPGNNDDLVLEIDRPKRRR